MLSSLDLIQKDCSSLKCIYLINFEISKYSSVQFSIDKLMIYKTFEFLTALAQGPQAALALGQTVENKFEYLIISIDIWIK